MHTHPHIQTGKCKVNMMAFKHKMKFNFIHSKRKEKHLGNHKGKYFDIYVIKGMGKHVLIKYWWHLKLIRSLWKTIFMYINITDVHNPRPNNSTLSSFYSYVDE